MRLSKISLLFLLVAAPFAFSEEVSFDGYKVFRVQATNKQEASIVQKLEDEFDFWNEGSLKGEADIMSSPEKMEFLESYFKQNNLNYTVLIKNVGKLIQDEKISNAKFSNGIMNWNAYMTWPVIENWIVGLITQYPGLVTVYTAGQSYEGNELYIIKISKSSSFEKKTVWVDGNIHAREWISPAFVTWMTNEILTNQNDAEISNMLDKLDFYIMPVHNPDGYLYTHATNRMWRKFRKNDDPSGNCPGTDGNRNYNYRWGGIGASTNPCAETFRGPNAFSEPEALAVDTAVNYFDDVENANWALFLTVHSYGLYILSPWGYTDELPENNDEHVNLAAAARDAIASLYGTRYTIGPSGATLYPTSGTSSDWAYGIGKFNLSYTYELRDNGQYGFILPPDQIIPCSQETWLGFKVMFNYLIN